MKIKHRNDILNDVIRNAKKHPRGWKAIFGKDPNRLSNDCYLLNPEIGVYLLKEYQKNPYDIQGIGGKIARQVDTDIQADIKRYSGEFGIIQGDIRKIAENLKHGIHPHDIFEAAIKGKNLGLSIPMRGRASMSHDLYDHFQRTFSPQQKKVDERFEKIASENGLYTSYE